MKFREFSVIPNLPEKLQPLLTLAYNMWWAWDSEAFALFRDIDPDLWTVASHDAVKLLYQASQERLNTLAGDEGFLFRITTVLNRMNQYMTRATWYEKVKNSLPDNFRIAYFSAEYGIAECLPVYSGGLGILAGDHLKSSSDLGLPLVAVGLLYSQGYFHQYLTRDGWQQEKNVTYDYHISPVSLVKNNDGAPIVLELGMPNGPMKFRIWKAQIGRVSLYLLDTNLPDNSQEYIDITCQLYGGDLDMRVKQEFLLGVGGMMALTALGLTPTVTHMNEGHSAFLSLERIRIFMKENNLSFAEARELVSASNIFTTHTPVPAGNDRFPRDLMERYLKGYVENNLKISFEDFLRLGKVYPDDKNELFCMTVLALKLSNFNNGVSKLHGHVSRTMWKDIWRDVPIEEVPIIHITNGIHMNSWISKEIADLFFRYLGTRWVDAPDDHEIWKRAGEIPDTELWRTHERRRERLVDFIRRKLKKQLKDKGASQEDIDKASEVLDPEALTIGFARRFATYKRATLIFRDIDRITKILANKTMPVQIIFAGKAHPKDDFGKEFIKQVFLMSQKEELRNRIVFLEDYDLNCAHYLVQGVDVWLNNPERPLEASGTSGMKVNFNGGLNLSTVDGWWAEKPQDDNGWSIGNGEEYTDKEYQDKVEANALYELLENNIVPLFYKRGGDDLPHEWIRKIKNAMQMLCPVFNTNRMVMEYAEKFYKTGAKQFLNLMPNNYEKLKNLARWKDKIQKKWDSVRISDIIEDKKKDVMLGEVFKIKALVHVDGLAPEDLLTEVYYGNSGMDNVMTNISTLKMNLAEKRDNNSFVFEADIPASTSGIVKYTIRVLPYHPELKVKFIPGYICWA